MQRTLLFLICLSACSSSNTEGSMVPVEVALNLSDSRGQVQAYPNGYWEFILKCEAPGGVAGAFIDHGTWTPTAMTQIKEYTQDPALLSFVSPVSNSGVCPQGDLAAVGTFDMLLPSNGRVCWRADAAEKPVSVQGLELLFADLVTKSQAKAQTCSPLHDPQGPTIDLSSSSAAGTGPRGQGAHGACAPAPCAGNLKWNPTTCACE